MLVSESGGVIVLTVAELIVPARPMATAPAFELMTTGSCVRTERVEIPPKVPEVVLTLVARFDPPQAARKMPRQQMRGRRLFDTVPV